MNPFDAAWALLKQWENVDWTGVPQIDSEGGMARQPAPVTEDPWTGVDWSDWNAQQAAQDAGMDLESAKQAMQLARVRQRAMRFTPEMHEAAMRQFNAPHDEQSHHLPNPEQALVDRAMQTYNYRGGRKMSQPFLQEDMARHGHRNWNAGPHTFPESGPPPHFQV